jgi:hypothetical protein
MDEKGESGKLQEKKKLHFGRLYAGMYFCFNVVVTPRYNKECLKEATQRKEEKA